MIASVQGKVLSSRLGRVVVDVRGVGFVVHMGPRAAGELRVGADAFVHTSLVVREDSLSLYGFLTPEERDLFEDIQTVSGIGPRIALGALAAMTPSELVGAIEQGSVAVLTRIPGVGRKSAQRMILELSGKLESASGAADAVASDRSADVVAALSELGWPEAKARAAVADAARAVPGGIRAENVSDALRTALQELGGAAPAPPAPSTPAEEGA